MKTLTVALPRTGPDAAAELHFVQSLNGQTAIEHGRSPLALLPKSDMLVLVVPTEQLSFHAITCPKAPKGKLATALTSIVEDSLLQAPEDVTVALSPEAKPGETCWVAVCNRAWLQAWIDLFDWAGHHVGRLVPQHAPQLNLSISAIGEPDNIWLVKTDRDGVVAAPLRSASHLTAALAPQQAVLAPPDLISSVESTLPYPVHIHTTANALLASTQSPWELAQFDMRVGHATSWRKRLYRMGSALLQESRWYWVRWGLVGLMVVNVAGLNWMAFQEKSAIAHKKMQQLQLFKQTFPQVTVVRDAPSQMTYELSRLHQTGSLAIPSDLESLLAAVGRAHNGSTPLTITQLDYQNRQLVASGFNLPADQVKALQEQLAATELPSQVSPTRLTIPSKGQP